MKDTRELASLGLTPNRALGQNFLVDEGILAAILDSADIAGRSVLEIGPGLGALTEGLLSRGAKVCAVEIDARLVAALRERFGETPGLTLLHADFLKADWLSMHASLGGGVFDVVANLPYYITTPICTRLFTCALPIRTLTLMVQKEAAQRFFAQPGERVYGPLRILCDYAYHAQTLFSVPPHCFVPQPGVESVVVRLESKSMPLLPKLAPFVDACFAMRRKTLANNLKQLGIPDPQALLQGCGIPLDARAEALDTATFVRLLEQAEKFL